MLSEPAHWQERRLRAMGSPAHLIVGGAPDALIDWAVEELDRLEQRWSRFRPDSELSQLVDRPGQWVPVSRSLLRILQRARRLWEWTAGAFDPTILPVLEALGYDRTFAEVEPAGPMIPSPPDVAGFELVELDEAGSAVRLAPGVRLDLGGLGKGLAADEVAEGLVLRGAASALLGLGGDIRAAGAVPDSGWAVPVADPFDPSSTSEWVSLGAEAVVTSTSLLRRWRRGDRDLHHIVDPLTGWPADTGIVAVVARGPEAWWAEGLAKSVMILGEDHAHELLDGTGVDARLFRADGTTRTVEGSVDDRRVLCSPM